MRNAAADWGPMTAADARPGRSGAGARAGLRRARRTSSTAQQLAQRWARMARRICRSCWPAAMRPSTGTPGTSSSIRRSIRAGCLRQHPLQSRGLRPVARPAGSGCDQRSLHRQHGAPRLRLAAAGASGLRPSLASEVDAGLAPAHGLIINVPLVDVEIAQRQRPNSGPAAIASPWGVAARARSKLIERRCSRASVPARRRRQLGLAAGSVLVRDCRLWHAGMPNRTSEARTMLAMVHWAPWWRDLDVIDVPEVGASQTPSRARSCGPRSASSMARSTTTRSGIKRTPLMRGASPTRLC